MMTPRIKIEAERALNYEEACRFLGLSKYQLARLVAHRKIPYYEYNCRSRVFNLADLKVFRESHRVEAG